MFLQSVQSLALLAALVLVCCSVLVVDGRPQEKTSATSDQIERRQDNEELTRATKIGDSMVYGLINNDSEDKDAKQEKEDFDSKVLTLFENIQQKIVKALNPGAIVDKATPEDYEKNPIEDYEAFRLGIVSGVDFLAKQLNAALDVPKKIVKKTNKTFTKALNDIGAKLVGLE
ncbi:hypothetical protein quinque_003088 [Culex quinquefasciatus]|uniref:uncharacterized protein LOC6043342 n=1 Tax=Culex quinquefasciatus TaxID=7176 RepID=UPI0018E3C48F|nr:uncharacterized protein LOC6043342 [Culex quinquefasciatus]